jgi:hypothetical protein
VQLAPVDDAWVVRALTRLETGCGGSGTSALGDPSLDVGTASTAVPLLLAHADRHDHEPEVLSVRWEGARPTPANGRISVVCGPARSGLVSRVREAASRGDAAALARLVEGHAEGRRGLRCANTARSGPPSTLGATPPIIQVGYAGVPITDRIVMREQLDGQVVVLPFAGGPLDFRRFSASTYVARGAPAPTVRTLVIVQQPKLSDFERRAVDRISGERAQGRGHDAGTTLARLLELRTRLRLARRLS